MRKRESLEAIERYTTGNCDWQLLAERRRLKGGVGMI
jgi:hypothetical protein